MSKSTTGALAAVCGALSAVLILAFLLISGRQSASAATGVTDPVSGQIKQVAIDMDPTGNSPGTGTTTTTTSLLGAVDPVAANVPLNSTHLVDVIVDEIAPSDGNIFGFGFDLHYDKNIVSIDTHNEAFMVQPGGFEPGVVPDPDASGDWRVDFGTLNAAPKSHGEGILVEVGIKCGSTIGSSTLTIDNSTNNVPGSEPQVFTKTPPGGDPTVELPVQSHPGGTIFCGESAVTGTPTASPTATASGGITESPTASPTATASGGITNSPTASPTATASGGITASPTATATATATATVTATPTHTPTPSPTATAVHTPTPTATPTPSGTVAGATTAHVSGSPTPKVLPNTGGPAGDGNSSMTTFLLMLALGGAVVLAAGGSVVYARAGRKE